MNELERSATEVAKRWVGKTLQSFCAEAEREFNGTAFDAIRASTWGKPGPRVMLAICITGPHELSLVTKFFHLVEGHGGKRDWNTYTLAQMMMDSGTDGFAYQDLQDSNGKLIAVALVATRPDKVELLSQVFHLPP